jgi:ribosomal protein L22
MSERPDDAQDPQVDPLDDRPNPAPEAEGTAADVTGVDKLAAEEGALAGSDEPQAASASDDPASEQAGAEPGDRRAGHEDAVAAAQAPATTTTRRRDQRRSGEPGVEVRATAKYVRTSARKARLVCDHIRGKDVAEARAILAFTPRSASKAWAKLLESAVANAEHNHELVGEDLKIASVHADEGPTLKRFQPRAMGRATRIRKRTSHLTITLTPKETR